MTSYALQVEICYSCGSRWLPVYCHCSTDNRAQTVLKLFQGAVDTYGLPLRVRCDRGVENYDVGYYMLGHP